MTSFWEGSGATSPDSSLLFRVVEKKKSEWTFLTPVSRTLFLERKWHQYHNFFGRKNGLLIARKAVAGNIIRYGPIDFFLPYERKEKQLKSADNHK